MKIFIIPLINETKQKMIDGPKENLEYKIIAGLYANSNPMKLDIYDSIDLNFLKYLLSILNKIPIEIKIYFDDNKLQERDEFARVIKEINNKLDFQLNWKSLTLKMMHIESDYFAKNNKWIYARI